MPRSSLAPSITASESWRYANPTGWLSDFRKALLDRPIDRMALRVGQTNMRDDLEQIVGRTREIATVTAAANSERTDREARWPKENFRALLDAGLGGLVVPRSAGGLGHRLLAVARVCEELARECASTAICFGMHHVGTAVLAAKATRAQTDAFLAPIAQGAHLTTLALSEPGTGSEFYVPESRLEIMDGDRIRISGEKSFVTNGGHADSYVVSAAAADANAAPGQFSCVVVPGRSDAVRWGPAWDGLGMRGNSSRTLTLDGVVLGRDHLLGEEGDEIWFVFNVIAPYFLVAMSGTYLGVTAAALEIARRHLLDRRHSHTGRALAQHAATQHRLGTMWAVTARTRALLYEAARLGERGDPEALPALCSAKAEVAECAVNVVNEAMSLLGGRGYANDSRIERLLRDARAAHVMAPTTDVLRTWTGRAVLELPLLGD